MTRGENIAVIVWILACAIWGVYTQGTIDGLTTRVNLLEARIHWQEAPLK
jgi:hypothetical protein